MKKLVKEQVISLHNKLVNETGGMHGIRDMGLLESAINSPYQTFDGIPLYPTLELQAARLCFSLVKNHAFIDGNKRIGVYAMMIFLLINEKPIKASDDDLIKLGLSLADSSMNEQQLIEWIYIHS